jgi:hypothetical protein
MAGNRPHQKSAIVLTATAKPANENAAAKLSAIGTSPDRGGTKRA